MTPSRQFMIQQAVLNALPKYRIGSEAKPGQAWARWGTAWALRCVSTDSYVGQVFCDQVRKEYSLLASRYQERNAA